MKATKNNAEPLYIFDLDGTLALIDHRRPILDNKKDSQRWEKFFEACDKDLPNKPIVHLFQRLCVNSQVMIFSGRSESVRSKTIAWLVEYVNLHISTAPVVLQMRPVGDSTPDDQLKEKWYKQFLDQEDKDRLVCVFDDRQKVVDMWRKNGVTCLQVAPGDF